MKILFVIVCMVLMLSGCGEQPTFETIADGLEQPVSQPWEILVDLPKEAVAQTVSDGEKLYFAEDMTVCLQTLDGGDLDRTLRNTTGFGADALQVMEYADAQGKCYECAWTAMGEGQLQVGRTRIIDDGNYHYAVSVTAPEKQAGEMQDVIFNILDSFCLEDPEFPINTGS